MVRLVTRDEAIDVGAHIELENTGTSDRDCVADIIDAVHQHNVYDDVAAERERQDAKWGGPDHDDEHCPSEFVSFIYEKSNHAVDAVFDKSPTEVRRRLIQVAALAVAAVESLDRKRPKDSADG